MPKTPNEEQLSVAIRAGRKALDDYSRFDSSMVPDDALETFCRKVVTAYLNAAQTQGAPNA